MARLITKKSTVAAKVPLAADLEIGELAVNTADAKLYTKHNDGNVVGIKAEPLAHAHAISDVTGLQTALDGKQDKLVSGTTIKTVGGTSILGSGDISVGVGDVTLTGTQTLTNKTLTSPTIDGAALSGTISGNATLSGVNVFGNASGQTFLASTTTTQDGVVIKGRAGGSGSFRATIQPTTLTASRTVTLPDANTTIPIAAQALTFIGPTAARMYTLPDANAELLSSKAAVTVTQGGTNLTTLPANNVILGNGTSNPIFVAPSTSGNVLTSNGTTWISAAPSGATLAGNNTFTGANTFTGVSTFTGANTFYNGTGHTFGTETSTNDGVIIAGRAGGSGSFRVILKPTTLTASRTLTLPDNNGTVLTTGAAVTVSQGGTGATTAANARSNLGAQETLISGTNIVTINGQSLLQAGNLAVGLGSFAASYSNTGTNATIQSSNISIGGTDTDVDFTIVPKGVGALQLDIPDGTATGGNKRGYSAVDLQKQRTVATQVASGARSFVVGGANVASSGYDIAMGYLNSASGFYSFAVGYSNEASGQAAIALGYDNSATQIAAVALGYQSNATGLEAIAIGRSNSASASNSCAIGRSNTASSPYATALGWNNTASANYNSAVGTSNSVNTGSNSGAFGNSNTVTGVQAYAFGFNNQVSAQYAMGLGIYGVANAYGATTIGVSARSRGVMNSLSIGSGTSGQQSSVYQLLMYTSNSSATVATTNGQTAGATNRLTLPNNSAFYGRIRLIASTSTGNTAKSWEGKFLIRRGANAAATTLVGSSLTSDYADSGLSAVTAALSADTTNGGLTLTVTGIAATNIYWTARIDTVEIGL